MSCFVYIKELSSSMTIVENLEKDQKELKETKSPEILPFGGHALASRSALGENGTGVGGREAVGNSLPIANTVVKDTS